MELINIVYRYLNRYINSEELVELLENIDKTKFSPEEQEDLAKIIENVQNVIATIPIEEDKYEVYLRTSRERILKKMEGIENFKFDNEKDKEKLKKTYQKLIKEREKVNDSGPRYYAMIDVLSNNSLYTKYYDNMTLEEILTYIAQYISVPLPPDITQETFDKLVQVGIKEDKREALWRLAFNYYSHHKDFSTIAKYFIKKKDAYYLVELICAVRDDLDMDNIINEVIETQDRDFIVDCGNRAKKLKLFTEGEIADLKKRVESIINSNKE